VSVAGEIPVPVSQEDHAPVTSPCPDLDHTASPGGVDDIPSARRSPEVDALVQMPAPPSEGRKHLCPLQREEIARGRKGFPLSEPGGKLGTYPGSQASREHETPSEEDPRDPATVNCRGAAQAPTGFGHPEQMLTAHEEPGWGTVRDVLASMLLWS
jgi:hypothetical protein